MKDSHNDNSFIFDYIDNAIRKTMHQTAPGVPVNGRILQRIPLNRPQRSIHMQKKIGAQGRHLFFIPGIGLSHIQFSIRADN